MTKIHVGNSDYTRQQMEQGAKGCGDSAEYFLDTIKKYEDDGYTVKFETSIWRKFFCVGIYKVIAYR